MTTEGMDKVELSEHYINLSYRYYKEENYLKCITAAKKSIAIVPNAAAYNNICSAYNQLKQYHKAIKACKEALKLVTDHELANGNLNYALQQRENQ